MPRIPSARRRLTWFMVGFTASTAVGLVLRAGPAEAQWNTRTRVTPPSSRQVVTPRRLPVPAQAADDTDADTSARRATAIVRKPIDGETPADPSLDDDDPANQALRSNGDGLPADGMEQPLQLDGVIPTGEADAGLKDGAPPTGTDPRLKSDIDAFENPPAGYDALAFQIDLPGAVLDRRPARLARFEPYDPVGIRRGAWIIYPELEIGAGATSNIFRAPAKDSATFFEVSPTVRAVTNWRVHAIELKATGLASTYPGFASENDRTYTFEARGRYDLTKRTNIEVVAGHDKAQDTRQSREFNDAAATRPDLLTSRAIIALNHRFNRLSLQLRGSYTDIDYENTQSVAGTVIDNTPRNAIVRETAARATWEFKPSLFSFTEVALNDRAYKATPADGIRRDSHGARWLVGLGFGNDGTKVRGEAALGYGRQSHEDDRLGDSIDALLLEANLGWRPTALTSFLLTAKSDINDSTAVGQSGSISRQFGLEARHAFRRELIGTAAVRHVVTSYRGVDLTETDTSGELGVEYFLDRKAVLFGRYTHTIFDSTVAGSEYNVDAIRVGLKLRQ